MKYTSRNPQSGVYKIINTVDGRVYIGGTHNLTRRKCGHFWMLKNGCHHSGRLQDAYDKFGRSAFEFEVIQTIANEGDLKQIEQKYIDLHRSSDPEHGYNISPNSETTTGVPCQESKKVLIGNANRGMRRTEEHKKIASEWTRQRNLNASPELRKKWSAAQRSRQRDESEMDRIRSLGISNRALDCAQIDLMIDMRASGCSHQEIAQKFGVHRFYYLNSSIVKRRLEERKLVELC